MMQTLPMRIDGRPVSGHDFLEVINPATGLAFARVPMAGAAQVDAAVAAAQAAFPAWRDMPDGERQALLHALGDAIAAHQSELMDWVVQESGKPINGLCGIGAGMEIGGAIAWTHATADLPLPVEVVQDDAVARVEVHRRPLGVVASITPWNWPLLIAIWHVMPALRAGNTVVVKPSEYTPLATLRFAELADAILPPGVLNVITGTGEVGAALARHAGVAKVMFTGSSETGRRIMAGAAATLKRLTLELGGNDAGIVLPDVDVKAVAPRLFAAMFHNNGQTCACLKRLYVHESIHDALCGELVALAGRVVVGNGADPATELGPVQNARQLAIVESFAESARREGGVFLCGGHRRPGPGYFFEPTIVAGLTDGSRLVDAEPFGPIVPVIRYREIDDAIRRANANPQGLGGSVWSADPQRAAALAMRLECGIAWVNEHGAVQPDAPFGGIKQSGFGVGFGPHGLAGFTALQTLRVVK